MRDQRCAGTVHRLLDELEGLLSTPQNTITAVDGLTTAMPVGATVMGTGSVDGSTTRGREFGSTDAPSVELASGQQGPAGGRAEERVTTNSGYSGVGARRRSSSSSGNSSLTQRLRSILISLREAVFRYASFLEFLPAPERVDRRMIVPGAGVDGEGIGNKKGQDQEKDVDVLDPEVGRTVIIVNADYASREFGIEKFGGSVQYS